MHSSIVASWSGASYSDGQMIGKQCPLWVFANEGDEAYGRFLLDPVSKSFVVKINPEEPFTLSGTHLDGAMLLTALWDDVKIARSSPRSYAELTLSLLPIEEDESSSRVLGARMAAALHNYLGPASREALQPRAERIVQDRMLHAPTLGLRIVNFRTFTSIAETRPALDQLKRLLEDPQAQIPGLELKPLDRWNIIAHLAQQGEPHTYHLLSSELAERHTGEDQKYHYAAEAAVPDPKTKARYFQDYRETKIQEDWLTQSLRPFNSYNQQALTLPYLKQALDLLPQIKANRKIFFLGAWLSAFLDGQSTPEAQAIVNQWLQQQNIDPDLRLKVLENKDALDRTVLIRRTFPN